MFASLVFLMGFIPGAGALPSAPMCQDPKYDQGLALKPTESKPEEVPVNTEFVSEPGQVSMWLAGRIATVHYLRFRAAERPGSATVIYLCGGPGTLCIPDGRPEGIPDNVNVIMFDYAGMGQNRDLIEPEQMSIESQGQIVEEIVKQANLRRYAIYGSSFGTAVATVAASRLSHDTSVAPPMMVVLDGTVGNLQCNQAVPAALSRTSQRAWQKLSLREQDLFKVNYSHLSAQLDADGTLQLNKSLFDSMAGGPQDAVEVLQIVISGQLPPKSDGSTNALSTTPEGVHEFRAAGCQQVADNAVISDMHFGGMVPNTDNPIPGAPDICDCPLLDRPYDPANFPIVGVPLLYVTSRYDVITPIECTDYHSSVQSAPHLIISLEDGGHAGLDDLPKACGKALWSAVAAGDLAQLKNIAPQISQKNCN